MGCCGKKKLQTIMTSFCASAAFVLLCIGVATDHWLYTVEIPEQEEIKNKSVPEIDKTKYTNSGLWRKCVITVSPKRQCSYIKYFSSFDTAGLEHTETILLSMRRSTIFPLIGLLLLLFGEVVSFLGHCTHKNEVLTFVAGIMFVVSGLCVLIGIILYIVSISNEAVDTKPRSGGPPEFSYEYGSSFMMTISSFILSELGGVLSVYLYISRHKHAYRKKQERLAMLQANHRNNPSHHGHHHHHQHNRGRSRSVSRDRDSIQESYFTYTPVSETANEMSNFTMSRDNSRQTMSTTAETHFGRDHNRDHLYLSRSAENLRRTTPV
ncbi:voltage-dependent calcium channel gamma-5 subunit-like [Tubulanus polymorphus]|uniref:voltage-dependent calcium channel gamma-5 subunit-like n=1 Tax=Tubulanus polymorphus TaxID=672921 RepID=UPI003DA22FBF